MTTDVSQTKSYSSNLVELMVDENRAGVLKKLAMNLPDLLLNDRQLCDLEMFATGAYSPLDGL